MDIRHPVNRKHVMAQLAVIYLIYNDKYFCEQNFYNDKCFCEEIGSFYYEHYVRVLDKGEQADRARLGKAYQTAGVLLEVLCAVNISEKVEEVAPEIIASAKDVQAKKKIYAPYNILPLDSAGASQAIMQLKEVKAVVGALLNTSGLKWPTTFDQHRQKEELDVLDWLMAMFGFQRDDVRNQRENLILLLFNVHIKLIPKPEPLNKLDNRAVSELLASFITINTVMNFASAIRVLIYHD